MGLPEQMADRQLAKGKGDEAGRIRLIRLVQNWQLAVVALGLFNCGLSLYFGADRPLWAGLAVLLLGLGYLNLRQRRHVKRRVNGQVVVPAGGQQKSPPRVMG